jgi:hypothetical protein
VNNFPTSDPFFRGDKPVLTQETTVEFAEIETETTARVSELAEFQLGLVGGGCGETIAI